MIKIKAVTKATKPPTVTSAMDDWKRATSNTPDKAIEATN